MLLLTNIREEYEIEGECTRNDNGKAAETRPENRERRDAGQVDMGGGG